MLRNTFIAAALLAASAGAMAGHDDRVYGRVIAVEPNFVISFGSGSYQDGFRVRYELGGNHFWTHSHHHPGHMIWLPHHARPVIHHPHHPHHWKHKWHDAHHDRHDHWDRRGDGRRDGHRSDGRHGRDHDRDHDRRW